ncbi:MAG: HlyC/CorC family transporter [Sphingobacteriales bacterium]|nr:HlyC/CorC family transporter [Sphingobacteriales bacterium]MBI3719965.1 HlyC/CorC family transporter [Sphingobacteriales bacterium]
MDLYTIIAIVVSILLIGFFAGIEIAFVSANKLSIELKKKQGLYSGRVISAFMEKPAKFIGTTLIGLNIFLVVYGLLVSNLFAPAWDWIAQRIPGSWHSSVNVIKFVFETVLSSFLILIFGEFIPKAIFRAKNVTLLSALSPLIQLFYSLLNPIASFFVVISQWILKYLFNIRMSENKEVFSRVDLENFIQQSKQNEQSSEEFDTEMFENALSLPKVKVRSCLIPRKEVEAIERNSSIEDVRKKFVETKLSKLVVYEDNIDTILGYIHQLDLFKNPSQIKEILLPIPAVPESMGVTDLIGKFTKERKSIAWVVDEFGGTSGIVTMEDLLEEIFGEIHDEYDTEEFVEKQISEDEYIFSGRLEVDYLNEKYGFEFKDDESETLSGYIIAHHETIPQQKERIIIDNYEFDILNVTDTRIESVKLKKL